MTGNELRNMYIDFFLQKGHKQISGNSLIPENDPTVLFTTAGMHPLVPYLLGEPHPAGKRLVNYQKCIRTGDIDSVGDATHCTFFEMLGNWSLGDYFKQQAIEWSLEFLTSKQWLGFPVEKLSVTVFAGDQDSPVDNESAQVWQELGIPGERIYFLPKEDNWWGPAGTTGPCGPDTEMFIDTGLKKCNDNCKPGCSCGKYFEIWNDVFMQYRKDENSNFHPLIQKNVDTGMGLDRTIAMLQGKTSVYETDLFMPIIQLIEIKSNKHYNSNNGNGENKEIQKAMRIVADHLRSAVFIIGDVKGITPSNLGQGYILRRLIRRSIRFIKKLEMNDISIGKLAEPVIEIYKKTYPEIEQNAKKITEELNGEQLRFEKTLQRGLSEFNKLLPNLQKNPDKILPGQLAFKLYDTYGFPLEFTRELCNEQGLTVDSESFDKAFRKHQEASKKGMEKVFKGGLADHSEQITALHTATHLLHEALRVVLGNHVAQKGSNITSERLRFDFSHPEKVTADQIKKIEQLVNEKIKENLNVTIEVLTLEQARKKGAIALFSEKYEENIKMYSIGDFSKEVCGGPHVSNTSELGKFKITKEQASSAGVRRIKAILE